MFSDWFMPYVGDKYAGHGCGPGDRGAIIGVGVMWEPTNRPGWIKREIWVNVRQMNCCAMAEVHGMDHSVGKLPKGERAEYLKGLAEYLHTVGNFGGVIATIVDQQRYGEWLEEAGFKQVQRFPNPKSGNFVTVWLHALAEDHLMVGALEAADEHNKFNGEGERKP